MVVTSTLWKQTRLAMAANCLRGGALSGPEAAACSDRALFVRLSRSSFTAICVPVDAMGAGDGWMGGYSAGAASQPLVQVREFKLCPLSAGVHPLFPPPIIGRVLSGGARYRGLRNGTAVQLPRAALPAELGSAAPP